MAPEVELATLDLRYEGLRLQQPAFEARLLASLAQRGIEEPLAGVEVQERHVLLDGFKRYRCARKLRLTTVPYGSLGPDPTVGLLGLLRRCPNRGLHLLEQAAFLDELKNTHQLSLAQLAADLSRSPAWVSVRLGVLAKMSAPVRQQLFAGAFPVYCYLYTLSPFRRLKGVTGQQIEEFILALSGKDLSVREVAQLAHGFFRGPESFRQEIRQGNLALSLEQMQQVPQNPDGCNEFERILLGDLQLLQKYLQRVMGKSLDPRLQSRDFHAQCHLLTGALLSRARAFSTP
jgi:hypothetical protein